MKSYTVGLNPNIPWSPSISTALHQWVTSVCVCMPYWYHALSCSSSKLHSWTAWWNRQQCPNKFCDGIQSLQTCVWHCSVLLKQDTCEGKHIWNASQVLSVSWRRCWIWLSPNSAMQPKESHLHSPRRQWSSPWPMKETTLIFSQDKLSMVPIHGLTFLAISK